MVEDNNSVYITSVGSCLPGRAIGNDEVENILGLIHGLPCKYKQYVLKANGIKKRYYAIDDEGKPTHLTAHLAVSAINNALSAAGISSSNIDSLSIGTITPDLVVPGIASQVHGRLGGGIMDLMSCTGVCMAPIAGLQATWLALKMRHHRTAISCGVERSSVWMHARRFAHLTKEQQGKRPTNFSALFLRWMLSDGAGAWLLESEPRCGQPALRLEWVHNQSFAHKYPTCMYGSAVSPDSDDPSCYWHGYDSLAEAESTGMMVLMQNVKVLNANICSMIADALVNTKERYNIDLDTIDHFLFHFSSYYFYNRSAQAFADKGVLIPQEKWYTNLAERGNTGAASIYIMLADAMAEKRFKHGERILLGIPESGRFSMSYVLLTYLEPGAV